jgi:YD repeat-containing protein
MSDREQHGLRGSIETCVEEQTYSGGIAGDGIRVPDRKFSRTTEYSVEGQFMAERCGNSDGSAWVRFNTYDASGKPLKSSWGNGDDPTTEMTYAYDDHGRLLSITTSSSPDHPVIFCYDEQGRKTKLQVSRPEDYRPNTAAGGSPFSIADSAPNLPEGGAATTFYDEQDRPTEVHIRDAQGELVSRAICIYDARGNVSEEQQILERPENLMKSIMPAQTWATFLKESGVSIDELREHISKLMRGQAGPYSITYDHDTQGRVVRASRRIFSHEHVSETVYNERGDKAAEITRNTRISDEEEQSEQGPELPSYSEVRYSYQYDDRSNWTEEIVSYRSSPDGFFESSTERRRRHMNYY